MRKCVQVGIASTLVSFPEDTPASELERTLASLNADATCDGILVLLPLLIFVVMVVVLLVGCGPSRGGGGRGGGRGGAAGHHYDDV